MAELPHQFGGKRTACPIRVDKVQQYMFVSDVMTRDKIAGAVEEFENLDYRHVHLYLMRIIRLQSYYCVVDRFWIINLNLQHKKTREKLYIIAEKLPPSKQDDECKKLSPQQKGYKWALKNELYTEQNVCALTACNELPNVIMNTDESLKRIEVINKMEQIINGKDTKKKEKWFKNLKWHKSKVVINTKECNVGERRYHILKKDFVKILNNAATKPINLIHILVVDRKSKCGYAIEGVWRVQIDNDLIIGVSFKYVRNNVIASNIYVAVGITHVYCVLSGQPYGKLFDGWNKSQWNNILVGDRKIHENKLKEDLKISQKKESEQLRIHNEEMAALRIQNEELKTRVQYLELSEQNEELKTNTNEISLKTMRADRKRMETFMKNSQHICRQAPNMNINLSPHLLECIKDLETCGQDDETKNSENENFDPSAAYNYAFQTIMNYHGYHPSVVYNQPMQTGNDSNYNVHSLYDQSQLSSNINTQPSGSTLPPTSQNKRCKETIQDVKL